MLLFNSDTLLICPPTYLWDFISYAFILGLLDSVLSSPEFTKSEYIDPVYRSLQSKREGKCTLKYHNNNNTNKRAYYIMQTISVL